MQTKIRWPTPGLRISRSGTTTVYVIGKKIGAGGFSMVYECSTPEGVSLVAKAFKPRNRPESEIRGLWQHERRLMLRCRHPNVITLYDAFVASRIYYLVMERAAGSVRQLVQRRGTLGREMVIRAGLQLLAGLEHIHGCGVLHRDLHIDNVFYTINAGGILLKIGDFGISRELTDPEGKAYTRIGRGYDMAPELAILGYTTLQSDIYQLGLILYYMVVGREALGPVDGPTRAAIRKGIARQRAEALRSDLGNVIAVMLRRREQYRYTSVTDVRTALLSLASAK